MLSFAQRSYLLFDFDGTVIDSREGIFESLRYVFDTMGMPVPAEDLLTQFIGPPLGPTFARLIGFTQPQVDEAIRLYQEHYSSQGLMKCTPYPGIPELLRALRAMGRHTALATQKPDFFARKIIRQLGMDDCFDRVLGASGDDHTEQKAEIIRSVLEGFAVSDPTQALMIGDTWYDCAGASAVGLDCLGVLYGFGDADRMRAHGAAAFVRSPAELAQALGVCGTEAQPARR